VIWVHRMLPESESVITILIGAAYKSTGSNEIQDSVKFPFVKTAKSAKNAELTPNRNFGCEGLNL
jgi:hypothetical protein